MNATTEALARQIIDLAARPAEVGPNHAAAQSALASMAVELAEAVLAEGAR